MKTVTLSAKTNTLGKQVFKGNKKLKTITIKSRKLTAKTLAKNAFKGVSDKVTIKVPKGKKKAYTALFRKKGLSKKVKTKITITSKMEVVIPAFPKTEGGDLQK